MMDKLVSVIIPTYDRAHTVLDAIRSVQEQSYPSVQIIVVDDGSRDATAKIISGSGVEYYYQDHMGQGAARNLGLRHAKGEYIASLDSDDIWKPEFLRESVRCLEEHDLDFVFFNWTSTRVRESPMDCWRSDDKRRKYGIVDIDKSWLMIDSGHLRRLFLLGCQAPTSAFLMRRSSIPLWNEEVNADDWFLILEMIFSKPCRAAFTLSPFWLKRVFGDNIYDGRDPVEITENHYQDDKVMKQLFYSRLTFNEKLIFRKRAACNVLNLGRLKYRRDGISSNVVDHFTKAIAGAPVGVGTYIVERLFASAKQRMKTINIEKRSIDEQES